MEIILMKRIILVIAWLDLIQLTFSPQPASCCLDAPWGQQSQHIGLTTGSQGLAQCLDYSRNQGQHLFNEEHHCSDKHMSQS